MRRTGELVWAADLEGGAPFVFSESGQPEDLRGFEVDLARLFARELTKQLGVEVRARFQQGPWDMLPSLLLTERTDLILNGYEWTPERARDMASSLPYYIYELQFLSRADDARITGPADFGRLGAKARIGVLGGSGAEAYVREHFSPGAVEVVSYDGNTNAMTDVATGKLDGTLQDLPIAMHFASEFPTLRRIGAPVAPGRYVAYLRPSETDLREAIDGAIRTLRGTGELRQVFERWNMWTPANTRPELLELPASGATPSDVGVFAFVRIHAPTLLGAAGMTVLLSVVSFPLAVLVGIMLALGRVYGPRWVAVLCTVYIEATRGTPLMLQLFVIFYMLPNLGLAVAPLPAAIAGLALNYAAYEAEIYRAGLQSVPLGQLEAALTLGMSRALAVRRIIAPQALRLVVPPMTNDFIAMFKDTSVCSVVTVVELTKRYNIAAMNNPSDIVPLAIITAVLYLAMSYPLSLVAARLERRLRR